MSSQTAYRSELEAALEAAKAAGAILREEFNRPGGPEGTKHHAKADDAAENVIWEHLAGAFPDYGCLGEELWPRGRFSESRRLWVVDPNDGTAAYMDGFRGSAVSIALLDDGEPVLGVVYAYNYPDDRGDLIAWAKGGAVLRNGEPCSRDWPSEPSADCVALVSHKADKSPSANAQLVAPMRYRAVPSIAYRLALIAAGEGEVGVSLNSPGNWDIAGGHALLLGAGGDVYNERGKPVRYDAQGHCNADSYTFGGQKHLVEHIRTRDWHSAFARPPVREPYALVWPRSGQGPIDIDMHSRAQGCLLGQLAGDALGSLVEFQGPEEIRAKYPDGVRELADGGTFNTIAGQPTDDSEMALLLARTLVTDGAYKPERAREAYTYWLNSGPFDCGNTVAGGLRGRLNHDSQANGAMMRVSPLGIFGAKTEGAKTEGANAELEKVAHWARQDAALTHPNRVCQEANALYAMAIAHAILTGPAPQELYQDIVTWTKSMETDESLAFAIAGAADSPPENYTRQQGWVLTAFRNALYQLLHAQSLEEGVVDTVMRGGDTDTNAAICGALLGSVYGRVAIPAQWTNRLLCCRPLDGLDGVLRARPQCLWPVDAMTLAARLLVAD